MTVTVTRASDSMIIKLNLKVQSDSDSARAQARLDDDHASAIMIADATVIRRAGSGRVTQAQAGIGQSTRMRRFRVPQAEPAHDRSARATLVAASNSWLHCPAPARCKLGAALFGIDPAIPPRPP